MNLRQLATFGVLVASTSLSGCVPAAQVIGSAALSAVWDEIKAHNKSAPSDDDVPVVAAKKPAPVVKVAATPLQLGSEWHYDDNYGLQVDGISGNEIRYRRTDDPTQWIVRRGFVREDSQSSTSKRQMMFSDLANNAGSELNSADPLVYRREFRDNGVIHDQVTSWSIEGHRQITVPAGSFDTYVIVTRTRSQTEEWTSFERWYYAPAVGNYVRLEYQYGDTAGSRVLMSYKLLGADGTVVASAGPQDPFQSHFADNASGHDETNFVAATPAQDQPRLASVARLTSRARNPAPVIAAASTSANTGAKASDADAMRALINQLNQVPPGSVSAPDAAPLPAPVPMATLPTVAPSVPVEPAPRVAASAPSVPESTDVAMAAAAQPSPPPVVMPAAPMVADALPPHAKHTRSPPQSDDTRALNEQQMAGISGVPMPAASPAIAPEQTAPAPVVADAEPPRAKHARAAAQSDDTRALNEQQAPAASPATLQAAVPTPSPAPVIVESHIDHAKHARTATTLAKSDDTQSLNEQQFNQLAADFTRPM